VRVFSDLCFDNRRVCCERRDDGEEVLKLGRIIGIVLACFLSLGFLVVVLLWRRRGYHGCRRGLPVLKSSDHSTEVKGSLLDGLPAGLEAWYNSGYFTILVAFPWLFTSSVARTGLSSDDHSTEEEGSLDGFPDAPSHTHQIFRLHDQLSS
jgi:hypothetical protein